MYWINFLHFYQPSNVNKDTIDAATEKSYDFILKIIEENEKAKITANVNATLLEHWEEYGYGDLIDKIKKSVAEGKIELAMSAAHHPILPLVPFTERKRQIEISREVFEKFFPDFKIKGFFFPEMIYDKQTAKYLAKQGFEWIILDELSYNGKLGETDPAKKYIDKNSGLELLFRQRNYSFIDYPPKIIFDRAKSGTLPEIAVSATDAELYGDRHTDYEGHFYHAVRDEEVECLTVSEFLETRKEKEKVKPKSASWDVSEAELIRGEAFNIWKNKKNKIHVNLWKAVDFSLKLLNKYPNDENYEWARIHADKGISSCVFWWASEKVLPSIGEVYWHPDRVAEGAEDLVRSVRSLASASVKEKLKAEKIYLETIKIIWQRHWTHHYEKK